MADVSNTDTRAYALNAFASRSADCAVALSAALDDHPLDGQLLLAEATALAELGMSDPFKRLENVLHQDPSWVPGQRTLAHLKIEFGHDDPLSTIERALAAHPQNPSLWHCYLVLLSSQDRHLEAAQKTAELRRQIGNVPALCLLEARFAGLAGDPARGATLLENLPAGLPDLEYQKVRNALQRNDPEEAAERLATADLKGDIRLWALAELTWRALGEPRHQWLMIGLEPISSFDLDFSGAELASTVQCLRALHRSTHAPPLQSLRNGTQTRGNLHQRREPALDRLFSEFESALAEYSAKLPNLDIEHPLFTLSGRAARITASWSVRLSEGGFHIPHLHDHGLLSSACHLIIPDVESPLEGALEIGRPPKDIALDLEPLVEITPLPGRLILFPSFLYHSTKPFGRGERLSAVFDAG
ncbi:MAG: hypothetical protein EP341_09200 [Sphingomonadales bacterium]|nr:MAG: hypothetical protein EP341_09200 [Sphingomonadales bacterium]